MLLQPPYNNTSIRPPLFNSTRISMDIRGPTRFRPLKSHSPSSFLSAYSHASQPSKYTAASAAAVDELSEDDIFTTDISEPADHYHVNHFNTNNNTNKKPNFFENFGILAALPESPTQCYHKSSVSTSRAIPGIPKPPQHQRECPPFGKLKYQSAPVNVPVLARAMSNRRKFHDVDEDNDEVDDEMVVPPHEIVARANTPVMACSVLEGVGRTLKGRDLRQVRNAVFRRTVAGLPTSTAGKVVLSLP